MKKLMMLSVMMLSGTLIQAMDQEYIGFTKEQQLGYPIAIAVGAKYKPVQAPTREQQALSTAKRDELLTTVRSSGPEQAAQKFEQAKPMLLESHQGQVKQEFAQQHGKQIDAFLPKK